MAINIPVHLYGWWEIEELPPFSSSLVPHTWLSRSVTLGEFPDCPILDLSTAIGILVTKTTIKYQKNKSTYYHTRLYIMGTKNK